MIFLSWNVRGLTDPVRRYMVRDDITFCATKYGGLDIVCLQEVKITEFQLQCACALIYPNSQIYSTKHPPGRGGAVVLLANRWHGNFVDWGVDPSNQVVWVLLEVDGMSFGILNVYASNSASERCLLWKWCAFSLPPAVWIVCGDFNMVERASDKIGGLNHRWALGEREAWFFMKKKLCLSDPNFCFSPTSFDECLWFTWNNYQVGQTRILKRLDRAMLSDHTRFYFHQMHGDAPVVEVIAGTIGSDHSLIMFTVLSSVVPDQGIKSQFFLNTSFLQHSSMMCHIWRV